MNAEEAIAVARQALDSNDAEEAIVMALLETYIKGSNDAYDKVAKIREELAK